MSQGVDNNCLWGVRLNLLGFEKIVESLLLTIIEIASMIILFEQGKVRKCMMVLSHLIL